MTPRIFGFLFGGTGVLPCYWQVCWPLWPSYMYCSFSQTLTNGRYSLICWGCGGCCIVSGVLQYKAWKGLAFFWRGSCERSKPAEIHPPLSLDDGMAGCGILNWRVEKHVLLSEVFMPVFWSKYRSFVVGDRSIYYFSTFDSGLNILRMLAECQKRK